MVERVTLPDNFGQIMVDAAQETPEHDCLADFMSEAAKVFPLTKNDPTFVYVIGVKKGGKIRKPSKVGISNNPEKRLRALQTGHYNELKLVMALLLPNRKIASAVERGVHFDYSHYGKMLRGEWIDESPFEVVPYLSALVCGLMHKNEGLSFEFAATVISKSSYFPAGFFDGVNGHYDHGSAFSPLNDNGNGDADG